MLPEEVGVWGWGGCLSGIGRNSGLKQGRVLMRDFPGTLSDFKWSGFL